VKRFVTEHALNSARFGQQIAARSKLSISFGRKLVALATAGRLMGPHMWTLARYGLPALRKRFPTTRRLLFPPLLAEFDCWK